MQVARNHHTVPRLFLKGFAKDGKQLIGRHRDGTTGSISVAKATVIRDFYDPGLTSTLDDSIETWFSREVESDGAEVIDALRKGVLPVSPAVDLASMFIAFQMVRGASFRRSQMEVADIAGRVDYAGRVISKMIETDPQFDPTDAQVAELAAYLGPRAPAKLRTVGPDAMMRNMVREAQRVKVLLPSFHWSLLGSNAGLLVTSDTPVVTRGLQGEFNDGPEVLPDDFEVLVPVSPSRLLVISPVPSLGSFGQLNGDFARDVNERQVRAADDLVMHHPDMAWPTDLVLGAAPPTLPIPHVTIGRSREGEPPSAMSWPKLPDAQIMDAMQLLGGDPPLPAP
ncbi:uncharacterized protein DUF4238 [Jatrophihabitans sp. GAS493]|nr:DUF4238 domain-containing protein [Jatrophihabitans sp. GAS493]SOD73544.1 uncharacterized protein DUF4238 [Jatrophihabitans sp. GAS493]